MSTTIEKASSIMAFMKYGPISFHQPMSREEFIALSSKFPDLRMEREKNGIVTVITPVKKGSGRLESIVGFFINQWKFKFGSGEALMPGMELPLKELKLKKSK